MSIHVPLPVRPTPVKAGPIGPGAGVMLTEYPLTNFLRDDPAKKMRRAWEYGIAVPWIRAAEGIIGAKLAGAEWTLQDPDDQPITDAHQSRSASAAYELIEKPQAHVLVGAKLSRRGLWRLTCRHLGLCGNAFWYLDEADALAGTPLSLLYLRPDRLTPVEDKAGNLTAWVLDRSQISEGTPLRLDEVVHFKLDEPDVGHFGVGLVESALLKLQLSQSTDQYATEMMASSGRISGIMAPKAGGSMDDSQYEQLVRDWRNIVEQPAAAKRLQVVRAPVDFTSTVLSMDDMRVIEMMEAARDALLALWGVPPSQIGIPTAGGLNSGDTRKYDEAALWQNGVHDRLVEFEEEIQSKILDRWQALLGWAPQLRIDEPTFDDDSPRYDLLAKSVAIVMTNAERRALIGLEPTGDPAIDNQIMLPMTSVPYATVGLMTQPRDPTAVEADIPAPDPERTDPTPPSGTPNPMAARMAGETSKAALNRLDTAAFHDSLVRLRGHMETHIRPALQRAVADVLGDQQRAIASRVERHWDHIRQTPNDEDPWWGPVSDRQLHDALAGRLVGMAETVDTHIAGILHTERTAKASPARAIERVLRRLAGRITEINETTRKAVREKLIEAIAAQLTAREAARLIEGLDVEATEDHGAVAGIVSFDAYRAELIARTELMGAYNHAALGSYEDAGLGFVQAIDGDGDPECAERDGQVFSIDDADGIDDHPNGTLDWVPYLEAPSAVAA